MTSFDLSGQHVVVTGASRGIGLAIARACADSGASVSALSRSASVQSGFTAVNCDVSDALSIERAFALSREANGPITMLVNNAGIADSAPLARITDERWNSIIATNLTGTFLCTRAAAADMHVAKFGRILNIASIAGLFGAPYIAAYCASKHGIVGMTRALAAEFDGSGICINALCPGYTETDMMRQAMTQIIAHTGVGERTAREQLAAMNPGGRIASVDEIADAALDLLSGDRNGVELVIPAP